MARLRTLGALELVDSAGVPVESILSRPRRAALLVYLAIEGRGGLVRRESLLPVFWPEMDQGRARAALRQSLYILRASLGDDLIVTRGSEEVGIGEGLACDASTFLELARAGDSRSAAELYRGDFLRGFFIPEAPEFERWVDARRDELRRQAAECERLLARAGEESGDSEAAVAHYRRSLEIEPTDEASLRGLMNALESGGDRAAALRVFQEYSESLRRDYDLTPSDETLQVATAVRERGHPDRQSPSPVRHIADGTETTSPRGLPTATAVRARRWSQSYTAGIVVLIVALTVAAKVAFSPEAAADVPGLVVMPFSVRGSAELGYLREGMADMLSTSLDGPELYRTVPPSVVVRDARARSGDGDDPVSARATAKRFGAQYFVIGSIVAADRRVRFDARLYGVEAEPVAHAAIEGHADSIFVLVDRLAARLIAESRGSGPAERLRGSAASTTTSIEALRHYLNGERALRDGAFAAAEGFFRKAIASDSNFAHAYYRLSVTAEWLGNQRLAQEAAQRAKQHASRLSVRDQAVLTAHVAMLRGEANSAEHQYAAILASSPDDVEAWLKMGEILFHNNSTRGRPIGEARAPFQRVLTYDPVNRTALLHLARLAAAAGNVAQLDSLVARYEALGIEEGLFAMRALAAAAHGNRDQFATIVDGVKGLADDAVVDAARDVAMFAEDAEGALAILRTNLAPSRTPERREMTHLQMASLELGRGHLRAAREHLQLACSESSCLSGHEVDALFAMNGLVPADRPTLVALVAALERPAPPPTTPGVIPMNVVASGARAPLRAAILSGLRLGLGDTIAAMKGAAAVDTITVAENRQQIRTALSQAARARVLLAQGRPEDALRVLNQATADGEPLGNLPWYGERRRIYAEALVAVGRAKEAVVFHQSYDYQSLFYEPFITTGALFAAELLDRAGDKVGAAAQYDRVIRRWRNPDPELRPALDRARERLAALRPP